MNNESVKVSIIIPVYNTEKYLYRCLKSVCSQTLKEIEIILIDDGSKDCSGEICDQYAAEDARIRVIHRKNGGSTSARQAGLAIAAGEYVGFMDSDDWVESDMYQSLYEIAVSSKADVVAEGVIDEIGDERWKRLNLLPNGKYETINEREMIYKNMISCKNFFCLGIQPYLWNKLVSRELAFLHINKTPRTIQVGEDAAAIYPMLVQANVIVVSDTAHYHYCHRSTSMMLRDRQEDQEYENAILLQSFLKKTFKELGIHEMMQEQLRRYMINNLLTRAYGKCAELDRKSVLFPFADIFLGDSIIIYGAGAFGQAVYQYAISCGFLRVKAWVDKKAAAYQSLGLEVWALEDVDIERSDKIIVAVFSESLYWEIRKKLTIEGITAHQIKWIDREKLLNLSITP